MARQGYRVLVCEPSPRHELGRRYDIIHIAKEHFGSFGLLEPGPGDEDYVETFHRSILRSALDKWPKNSQADILVLRRLPLMRRLSRWAEDQGAQFAQNLAMLSGAVNCTPEENDYEFSQAIIFEDETEKGRGSLPLKLLKALITGGLSLAALKNLLGAASIGGKMYRHYRAFPENPANFDRWVRQTEKLWAKAGNMADMAEPDLARINE